MAVHAVVSAALQHLQGVSMLSNKLPCQLNCVSAIPRLVWGKRLQARAGTSDLACKRGSAVQGTLVLSTTTTVLTAADMGCALTLQSFSAQIAQREVRLQEFGVTLTQLPLTTTVTPLHRLQHLHQMWRCLTSSLLCLLPSLPSSGESS